MTIKMRKQQFAAGLPQEEVAAQMTDNTAASTGNSGTVKIGKGADESCSININLSDSPITVITGGSEVCPNVGTQPARKYKASTQSMNKTTNAKQSIVKAVGAILAMLGSLILLLSLRNTMSEEIHRK